MRVAWLKRYSKKWGGNKLSAFYGIHTFVYGGSTVLGLHIWPVYIEFGPFGKEDKKS